jgi:micrococcal nuclease
MYEYQATVLRVVDGDTICARVDLGFEVSVDETLRLAGINAPERGKPGGSEASAWLRSKLLMTTARIVTVKDKREKYGRYLAEIFLPGETTSVNSEMIAAGHAVPYDGGKRG